MYGSAQYPFGIYLSLFTISCSTDYSRTNDFTPTEPLESNIRQKRIVYSIQKNNIASLSVSSVVWIYNQNEPHGDGRGNKLDLNWCNYKHCWGFREGNSRHKPSIGSIFRYLLLDLTKSHGIRHQRDTGKPISSLTYHWGILGSNSILASTHCWIDNLSSISLTFGCHPIFYSFSKHLMSVRLTQHHWRLSIISSGTVRVIEQ